LNDPNKYAASRWLPVNGMGKVCQYMTARSIRIGLLKPQKHNASYILGDANTFKVQLGDKVDFDYRLECDKPSWYWVSTARVRRF
jgi:hypothetical protein